MQATRSKHVLIAPCAPCFCFSSLFAPRSPPRRPTSSFILADDFGYGDLGCMGCTDIATPNIDRLAAEGVKFTDFYANAPVCTPTRAGFITGRWQQRCGLEFAFGYQVEQFRRVNGAWVPEKTFTASVCRWERSPSRRSSNQPATPPVPSANGISASKTSTIR
jgi:hypothetical protein